MRYVALGQQDDSTCINLIQQRLYTEGRISASARTGVYNQETSNALNLRLGAGWPTTPAGPCGVYAALNLLPAAPISSGIPAASQGISQNTLLIGAGILGLVVLLVMKK